MWHVKRCKHMKYVECVKICKDENDVEYVKMKKDAKMYNMKRWKDEEMQRCRICEVVKDVKM